MPETSDSDFSWREYVRGNNDELVATYGNLVHRVLTMSYRNFDKSVPQYGELDCKAEEMLKIAERQLRLTGENIALCKFRAALNSAMTLAQETNRYLDHKAPWLALKTDRQDAATSLWVGLTVVNCLKIALCPFLPFSSKKLHDMLGFDDEIEGQGWNWTPEMLESGQKLSKPKPLFTKLDESLIERESKRIGQ